MASSKWIADLAPEMTAEDAARDVLRARLQRVGEMLPLAALQADEDIEHVHQLRVATRRADAAVRIFRDCLPRLAYRKARRRLRKIRRAAGAARDGDVFGQEITARSAKATPRQQPGLDYLLGHVLALRTLAQVDLVAIQEQEGPRFALFVSQTLAAVRSPEGPTAPRSLQELARPLVEDLVSRLTAAAAGDLTDYTQLHRVRIEGKRLRYACEVLARCFEPAFLDQVYPRIEQVQEILGRANDSHVAAERLTGLRARIRALSAPTWKRMQAGIEQMLRLHQRRLPEERRHFLRWWHDWHPETAMLLLRMLRK